MNLKNEFNPIREWATDKGIYLKGDPKTQSLKLFEEAGELAKAILNEDPDEIIDAIGDCCVVLTSIAELCRRNIKGMENAYIESCINTAYEVIAKRSGKMQNGTFVKNEK